MPLQLKWHSRKSLPFCGFLSKFALDADACSHDFPLFPTKKGVTGKTLVLPPVIELKCSNPKTLHQEARTQATRAQVRTRVLLDLDCHEKSRPRLEISILEFSQQSRDSTKVLAID
jgi:hypothetical protein